MILTQAVALLAVLSGRLRADTGTCGGATTTIPFTDVGSSIFFCQIAEAFFSGLTNGTSATTYSPSDPVTRDQMAAFITRTQDSALRRGSRRAALRQFWIPQGKANVGLTTVGSNPVGVESDGADLWVANQIGGTVSRVRAGDGGLIATWTGANSAFQVLIAMGRVFVTGATNPGSLYEIDPTAAPGAVKTVSSSLGAVSEGIAFDGASIWVANAGTGPGTGSVSRVTVSPLAVTTFTTGFNEPVGVLFDGANVWVTDSGDNKLKKLDGSANVLQAVNVGSGPLHPAFDGTNIWVPNFAGDSVTVVRASTGAVLATLTGQGLVNPFQAAFDGQRILVTDQNGTPGVSLWRAVDLTPLGFFALGTNPAGACSDGVNFWIALLSSNQLARF
jgi:DNA-binding beta-propeller fold protein YncE